LRGFEQQEGTDYGNTYAAVVRNETTRLLLSLCAVNNWEIDQLDAISAFLNSEMDRIIYMRSPPGMQTDPNLVCRVNLALYGAKQSAKLWADDAYKVLLSIRFEQSKYDNSLYFRREDRIYIITHVNDFKVIGLTRTVVNKIK
jgi:hypothetical protein